MGAEIKYYKVLRADALSPTKNFDYAPYLPKGDIPGEWMPEIPDAQIRKNGYYVAKHWNFWFEENACIYEVEVRGLVAEEVFGAQKQACCKQIRLLKDVTEELIKEHFANASDKSWNIGIGNIGSKNIGSNNVGKFNIGNRNTGDLNLGDFNTGDSNTGLDNVGDNNKGSANTGCHNIGHSNSGHYNVGSYNAGSNNIGSCNAGSFNKGNFNVGKWNIGKYQTGYFNTQEPCVRMFNKPTNLKASEIKLPTWLNSKDIKNAFANASKEEIVATLNLPNFDYKIFEEITGISKSDFDVKLQSFGL